MRIRQLFVLLVVICCSLCTAWADLVVSSNAAARPAPIDDLYAQQSFDFSTPQFQNYSPWCV